MSRPWLKMHDGAGTWEVKLADGKLGIATVKRVGEMWAIGVRLQQGPLREGQRWTSEIVGWRRPHGHDGGAS